MSLTDDELKGLFGNTLAGDIQAAWAMEEEVKRRGLIEPYTDALIKSISQAAIFNSAIEIDWYSDNLDGWGVAFALAHAPPDKRGYAVMQAITEKAQV